MLAWPPSYKRLLYDISSFYFSTGVSFEIIWAAWPSGEGDGIMARDANSDVSAPRNHAGILGITQCISAIFIGVPLNIQTK